MTDGVVLLHGIFRTRRSMQGLASFLKREGFETLNLGYKSTKFPLEELAEHIHTEIERFIPTVTGDIHFIGYSMGGLLVRAYLRKHRPARMGRLVLVGTPNGGSEVADKIMHWWAYRKLYGPAGQQLITNQKKFRHILGDVNYDLAVIAGNRCYDPVAGRMIGKPNDGKVSIDSTRLDGMKEHMVIAADHTFFPSNRKMWRLALQFIRYGTMRVH